MAKSENNIHRFRGNILRFTTKDFEQFSYCAIQVSDSTILRKGFVEINLRLYHSSDSTILLFYDSSFQFYDFT